MLWTDSYRWGLRGWGIWENILSPLLPVPITHIRFYPFKTFRSRGGCTQNCKKKNKCLWQLIHSILENIFWAADSICKNYVKCWDFLEFPKFASVSHSISCMAIVKGYITEGNRIISNMKFFELLLVAKEPLKSL